jgi:hypothetical protein
MTKEMRLSAGRGAKDELQKGAKENERDSNLVRWGSKDWVMEFLGHPTDLSGKRQGRYAM